MGRLRLTKFFCFFLTLCLVSGLFLGLAPSAYAVDWSTTDSTNLKSILTLLQQQIGNSSYNTFAGKIDKIVTALGYSGSNSNSMLYPLYQKLDSINTAFSTLNGTSGYLAKINTALDALKTSASTSTSTFYPMYQKLDSMNTNIGDIETALTGTGAGSIKKYLSDMQSDISSLSFSVSSVSSPFYSLYSSVEAIHKLFTYDTSFSVNTFGSSNTTTSYGFHNAVVSALNQVIKGLTFIGTQDTSSGGSVNMDTVNNAATKYSVAYDLMVQSYRDIGTINSKLGDVQFSEYNSLTEFPFSNGAAFVSDAFPGLSFSPFSSVSSTSTPSNTVFDIRFTGSSSSGSSVTLDNTFWSSESFELPAGTYVFSRRIVYSKLLDYSTGQILSAPSDWRKVGTTVTLPEGGRVTSFYVYLQGTFTPGSVFPASSLYTITYTPYTFSGFTNLFQRLYNAVSRLSSYFASPDALQRKEDQKDVVNDVLGEGVSGGAKVKVSDVKSVAGTASDLLGRLSGPGKVSDLPAAFDEAFSSDDGHGLSWFTSETADDLDSVPSTYSLDPSQEIVTSYYEDGLQYVLDFFSRSGGV